MARFVRNTRCPRCTEEGRDRAGDNLALYSDGGTHCWACGYHKNARYFVREVEEDGPKNKAVLPADFTREIPAAGWQWLLQWGLPYTYWRPYTGYSPKDERLIFTAGVGPHFSIGRYVGKETTGSDGKAIRKWYIYGDRSGYAELLEPENPGNGQVVIVEDVISQHKVAQVTSCLCLYGTNLHDAAIKKLIALKRPVSLWLDRDQYTLLAPKIGRLNTFLEAPVGYISTDKDPKAYSLQEIKEIVG